MGGLFDSKSNIIAVVVIVLIAAIVLTSIAVKVLFGVSVIEEAGLGAGSLLGGGGGALWRNVKVDGPIRQQAAMIETAKAAVDVQTAAKAAAVEIPPDVWKPGG